MIASSEEKERGRANFAKIFSKKKIMKDIASPHIKMHILTKLPIVSYPRRFSLQLATTQEPEKKYLHSPRDSFHRAIYPTLLVAQIFGVFPVLGISASNCSHLRFQWFSFRAIYSAFFICFCIFMACSEMYRIHRSDAVDPNYTNAKSLAGLVFYMVNSCATIIFFYIATRWKKLMMHWEKNESVFQRRPYCTGVGMSLRKKITIAGSIVFLAGFVEHCLAKSQSFYSWDYESRYCNNSYHGTLHYYANRDFYAALVLVLPFYHPILGILFYLGSFMMTFTWTFIDFFIIVISLGISERFRQFNDYLNEMYKSGSPQIGTQQFWKTARFHFGLICEILENVDRTISVVVIISCLSNLYHICLQVLNVATKLPYTINYVYYWASLTFLILRTAAVFLFAAEVNEQAVKPLELLRRLPNSMWNVDVERLADQIRCETIALSGMRFYFLTRRLLFGMMGTIITYEIVLMQFGQQKANEYKINCY
ncbi:gustatory receptor for sugar taste 64a-like [Culicoides brevitarsis]|uniref:gustatory receptor for sugar taste 64a-like n=1 Tax=Culicoides brevitarsis TaxID=469753 RepID=UPI00307B2878